MTNPDNVGGLLPCPFCGHDESLYIEHVEGTIRHPAYYVRCDYCGAQTGSTDSGEHVKKWNERAELCRAAPAGGVLDGSLQHKLAQELDSAPAGPGEVGEVADWLDRAAAKWSEGPMAINWADADRMRNAAALLRKIQQGAESFVSCTCHEERQKALCLNKHRCVRAYPLASQGQEGGNG